MRAAFVLVHRWLGLTLAGLLIVAGLTGSVIAFWPEIDRALNPELFTTESRGDRLATDVIVARAEQAFPGLRVYAVELPWESDSTAALRVEPSSGAAAIDQVFVDPVTGKILGARLWGECCLGRRQFVPFVYELHYSLHLPGRWGPLVMGGAALAWAIDCFVALALAMPRGGRRRIGWNRALTVKRGAGRFRLAFDLHRAGGLWIWALLLMMAVTGVALNLKEQVFKPVVSAFAELTPGVFDQLRSEPVRAQRLTYDDALQAGARAASERGLGHVPAYAFYSADAGVYGIAIAAPDTNPRDGLGPSWVFVDHHDGSVLATEIMGEGTNGDVFLQAQLPLHGGRIIGPVGRAVTAALGLATAALSVTGIIIWRRKRLARERVAPRHSLQTTAR